MSLIARSLETAYVQYDAYVRPELERRERLASFADAINRAESKMRFEELNPVLKAGYLRFDCPKCRTHSIRVPICPNAIPCWKISGEMPNISLDQSVNSCWHGEIKNGEVITIIEA